MPEGSTVTGIADLGGKKVCAAAGSTSIQNIAAAPSKPIPVSVNDWTDCLVMLQQGQVDAISTDDTILAGLAGPGPDHPAGRRRVLLGAVRAGDVAAGAPTSSASSTACSSEIRADGRWAALSTQQPGSARTPPPAGPVPGLTGDQSRRSRPDPHRRWARPTTGSPPRCTPSTSIPAWACCAAARLTGRDAEPVARAAARGRPAVGALRRAAATSWSRRGRSAARAAWTMPSGPS